MVEENKISYYISINLFLIGSLIKWYPTDFSSLPIKLSSMIMVIDSLLKSVGKLLFRIEEAIDLFRNNLIFYLKKLFYEGESHLTQFFKINRLVYKCLVFEVE